MGNSVVRLAGDQELAIAQADAARVYRDWEHSDFVGLGSVLENCLNHLIFKVLPSPRLVIRP